MEANDKEFGRAITRSQAMENNAKSANPTP